MHPVINYALLYYKYYPIIYLVVCTYHVYSYYEYAKVISYYISLITAKKIDEPKEEDYEWVYIEENILDDDQVYFDLNMMVMVTEPDNAHHNTNDTIRTSEVEGEPGMNIDFYEISI